MERPVRTNLHARTHSCRGVLFIYISLGGQATACGYNQHRRKTHYILWLVRKFLIMSERDAMRTFQTVRWGGKWVAFCLSASAQRTSWRWYIWRDSKWYSLYYFISCLSLWVVALCVLFVLTVISAHSIAALRNCTRKWRAQECSSK